MEIKKELIRCPVNYIGNKYKLLSQILPYFPGNINMFYDVFGGGATVSVNVEAEHIYYNDLVFYMSNMFKELKGKEISECLREIHSIINKYNLNKTNKEGFEKIRSDYNDGNRSWSMFFVLMSYSFNSQYRFNNKKEYNSSFGKNRSYYSENTEKKFIKFLERLNDIDIVFDNKDFRDIDYSDLNSDDFVYFDPPYLITTGNYNDGKRGFKGWNEQDDLDLMELCDYLDSKNIKFALSNVLEYRNMKNNSLIEWSKKYKVIDINAKYYSYYTKKDKDTKPKEVLIINY